MKISEAKMWLMETLSPKSLYYGSFVFFYAIFRKKYAKREVRGKLVGGDGVKGFVLQVSILLLAVGVVKLLEVLVPHEE